MTEEEQNPESETADRQEVPAGEPGEAPTHVDTAPATAPRTVTVQVRYLLATAAATGVLILGLLVAVIVGAADANDHGPPALGGPAAGATLRFRHARPSGPSGPAGSEPGPGRNAVRPVGSGRVVGLRTIGAACRGRVGP